MYHADGTWVRWIGWILVGVRDAGRDLCGVDHLEHAQGYVLTWPMVDPEGVDGNIHTNWLGGCTAPNPDTLTV